MRGSCKTIKEHPWFVGLDWDTLLGKLLKPPYIPAIGSHKSEISSSKKNIGLHESIEKEEAKDASDLPRHKVKPPPGGWDDKF